MSLKLVSEKSKSSFELKKISVVILTYNSENHIYDCLESLFFNNDIGDSLEVIIVDNNSNNSESLFAKLKEIYDEKIITIKNVRNGGYGQGNNVGVMVATAPIVMIMNPDVRLLMPVFSKIVEYFSLNPNLVMVGMKQMYTITKAGASFALASKYRTVGIQLWEQLSLKFDFFNAKIMCLAGACFSIRKNVFVDSGMFDENIFMYCEERDLFYRIKSKGEILYDNSLRYLHLAGDRFLELLTLRNIMRSRLYLGKKYNMNRKLLLLSEMEVTMFKIIKGWFKHNVHNVRIYKLWLKELSQIWEK